ncbi:MAG TPA: type II toxin-antitoxin system VapC family toxin [Steroidobacteraceae bacterium]|nr:type II toxin-antitoxin system VapC family toxin [Steroidobacteraceae bacterium]
MIVVDTSALMAILRREPEADSFLRIISQSERCLLSSVSLLEISMVLAGSTGDATAWKELDALIARAGMYVVAQDTELTEAARGAFLRYGKGRHPAGLNLGDCASYALARHRNLPLLFKGDDFPKTDLRSAA